MKKIDLLTKREDILDDAFFEPIKKALQLVEEEFKNEIKSVNPEIQDMINYLYTTGGKRLRPALVLISSLAWESPNYKQIVKAALCIELIHIATLIHDDVIDDSDLRRGIDTYNKKWGNSPSVLFGDFLFSRAFAILARLGNLQIIENLSTTTSEICEGEIMQNFLKNNYNITINEYLKIIKYKTASLIAESCRVGVIMANLGVELEERLYQFGYHLGMAFQIYDDYLDFQGDREKLGKPVFNDIKNGYITLPVIHLLNQSSNGKRDEIFNELKHDRENDLTKLKELLNRHKSLEYTLECAKDYVHKAEDDLSQIKNEKLRDYLTKISQFIVSRKF